MNTLQEWEQSERECRRIVDACDKSIDSGIFELVVGLNALGITTGGSCEGHLDHGTMAPWIDIEDKDAAKEAREAARARKFAREVINQGHLDGEEESRKFQSQAKSHDAQATRYNLLQRLKLMKYLDAFYTGREVSYDQRLSVQGLVVGGIVGPTRLESQGAGLQEIRSSQERERYLRLYQEEMQSFTVFLKSFFFSFAG